MKRLLLKIAFKIIEWCAPTSPLNSTYPQGVWGNVKVKSSLQSVHLWNDHPKVTELVYSVGTPTNTNQKSSLNYQFLTGSFWNDHWAHAQPHGVYIG